MTSRLDIHFYMLPFKSFTFTPKRFGKMRLVFIICLEGRDIHIECSKTIQMKLILICVWAEPAVLGSARTALKFKYEIQIG